MTGFSQQHDGHSQATRDGGRLGVEHMFQPGRARGRSFTDFAEFARFGPEGWNIEVFQTSGGVASASLASIEISSVRLDAAVWNQGHLMQGEALVGAVVIAGSDCSHSLPRFQGRQVDGTHLPLLPGGVEFEYVAEGPGEHLLMTIERQAFERHMQAIWGHDLPSMQAGCMIPLSRAADAAHLRGRLSDFFGALSGQASALGAPRVAELAEDQLLSAVLTATTPRPIRVLRAHRHHVARAAVKHLRSRRDEAVTMRDLCEKLGTSWRALDLGFRELLGISPSSYLRIVRLHGVRRALRAADPAAMTVTEIATGWGFFHLGRFSVEYRRLFGESPSETLWKRHPVQVH